MDGHRIGRRVAVVVLGRSEDADAALSAAVDARRGRGVRLAGRLQHSGERLAGGKRSMWPEGMATDARAGRRRL